jgi:hypothetical protein
MNTTLPLASTIWKLLQNDSAIRESDTERAPSFDQEDPDLGFS